MKRVRKLVIFAFLCSWALLIPSLSSATPITGTGTGTGGATLSASADFSIVSHDFNGTDPGGVANAIQIILSNTSPAATAVRGNLLTGLFWTFSGVASLSTAIDGQADAGTVKLSTSGVVQNAGNWDIASAVNNVAPPGGQVNGLDGGYQLSNGPFGTANNGQNYAAYEYGIATIAYGLTGWPDSNAMGFGDVHDYGIVSSIPVGGVQGGARNYIDNYATFWIPYAGTSIPEFTNYAFTFGSLPDNQVAVDVAKVPEPMTLILYGFGFAGAGLYRHLRRKPK